MACLLYLLPEELHLQPGVGFPNYILEYRNRQLHYNKLRVSGLGAHWQGIPSSPEMPSGMFKPLYVPFMMLI